METIYIRLEIPPRGSDHARTVPGRAAAKNWEKLNHFAKQLKAVPLDSFLGMDSDGQEEWFRPADALATLARLIPRITTDRRGLENARLLIRDLSSFENILMAAAARGSKFRFSLARDEKAPSR